MSDDESTGPQGYKTDEWSVVSDRWSARQFRAAFTLAELVITVGVLVLLVLLFTQLLKSAATVTTLGNKQMDADSQARQVLDRMAIDFAQMVKRSDVDYYVKSSWFATGTPPPPPGITPVPVLRAVLQHGNDQIAFYSSVPGYYPATGAQSPVSLVAYRINSDSTSSSHNKMERLGKGLVWNAVSPSDTPVVFMPVPVASVLPTPELPPSPTPTPSPPPAWPQASSATTSWLDSADSEVIGPQVFRFEYYYLLKNGTFSDDPMISPHYTLSGMQDVSAIVADIVVIDPKSKVLLSDSQISQVASQLVDWGNTGCAGCPTQLQWQSTPGLLTAQWRSAIDANTLGLPRPAISGIRLYERVIYLSPPTGP
jgi:hypothetical protein